MSIARCDRHGAAQPRNLDRHKRMPARNASSELSPTVVAPTPDRPIRAGCASMLEAGANRDRVSYAEHSYGRRAGNGAAVSELSIEIVPPATYGTRGAHDGAGMREARGDRHDAAKIGDRHGSGSRDEGAVTQLAELVVAPARRGSVVQKRASVLA